MVLSRNVAVWRSAPFQVNWNLRPGTRSKKRSKCCHSSSMELHLTLSRYNVFQKTKYTNSMTAWVITGWWVTLYAYRLENLYSAVSPKNQNNHSMVSLIASHSLQVSIQTQRLPTVKKKPSHTIIWINSNYEKNSTSVASYFRLRLDEHRLSVQK